MSMTEWRKDPEFRRRVIELLLEGKSKPEIAAEFGCNHSVIYRYVESPEFAAEFVPAATSEVALIVGPALKWAKTIWEKDDADDRVRAAVMKMVVDLLGKLTELGIEARKHAPQPERPAVDPEKSLGVAKAARLRSVNGGRK
jgi:transposase